MRQQYRVNTVENHMYFGSSRQLAKCEDRTLDVNGELVERPDVIKYLGAYMDE